MENWKIARDTVKSRMSHKIEKLHDVKIKHPTGAARRASESGQTLVEVMVAMAVLGFMMVALYAGFSSGFAVVRVSRENLRATQILAEGMEVARLYNWDQVVNQPGYIPATFTAPFYANGQTNAGTGGFLYTVTVSVTNAPISEAYSKDLRMIQINLTWKSGNITRNRQMNTFVSQYGMQNYKP